MKAEAKGDLEQLSAAHGVGALLSLREILGLKTGSAFRKRFRRTALMRAGRESLLRNACLVAANTGAGEIVSDIVRVSHEDRSAIVRWHALWALDKLARQDVLARKQLDNQLEHARSDPDQSVSEQATRLLVGNS